MASTAPENSPATPGGAVFVSYAREDGDAARRIADALRGFGVEAWLDQSELRGADAWDQKIRRQIKECSLFLPLISAHTQRRGEGYFRLEWKLAAERTHLMAEGVPFLVPVVIDDTPESAAAVPPEFLRVQWTRLPGGVPTPEFVSEVKRLLAAPKTAPSAQAAERAPYSRRDGAVLPNKSGLPKWSWAVLAIGAIALGLWTVRPKSSPANGEPKAHLPTPPDLAPAKSVAVLPFANLSADKDNEYFSDGLTENILDKLAQNPGLRVMARTSSFSYKGKNVPISQIAQELKVGTIIEGSVQRSGQKLRITAQLINAADGSHVWSETFDRELTDIFAVQDEIALKIAARLEPGTSAAPVAAKTYPTKNLAAYDAYLRGRAEQEKSAAVSVQERARKYFQEAVTLDPQFGLAWAQLSSTCTRVISGRQDFSADVIAQARTAAATAARLAPDLPETLRAASAVKRQLDYDVEGAGRDLDRAEQLRPNDARTTFMRANVALALGDWDQAVALGKRAIELNPRDGDGLQAVSQRLYLHGLYSESRERLERVIAIYPDSPSRAYWTRGLIEWRAAGNAEEALAQHERTPMGLRDPAYYREHAILRRQKRDLRGASVDFAQARDLARQEAPSYLDRSELIQALLGLGETAGRSDDRVQAAAHFAEALPLAEALAKDFPTSVEAVICVARIQAGRDERAAAFVTCDRALARALRTRNPINVLSARENAVSLWAALGRKDEAIALLRTLHDAGFAYGYALRELQYDPLRDDPRFKQMQADEEARADANWRVFAPRKP